MRPSAAVALTLVAGVLAGCSGGSQRGHPPSWPGLRSAARHAVAARTVRTPAPRSDASAPPDDLVMLDARRGALIGRRAGRTVIQRTVDGGAHWQTVLSSTWLRLRWIGRDGKDLVATGSLGGRARLLRSGDGGRRWRTLRPRVAARYWRRTARFAFSGRGGALATPVGGALIAPDARAAPRSRYGVLRSGDHGRSWRAVRLPGGGEGRSPAFTPDGRAAFVASSPAGCRSGLSRSDDQGAHWRLLDGACGDRDPLLAVAFSDARHGYAAGGSVDLLVDTRVRHYAIRTADGGRMWRRAWRRTSVSRSAGPFLAPPERLVFSDRRHGWALSGGSRSASGLIIGGALYTGDGGAHWHDSGRYAARIAITGPRSALIADGESFGSDEIARLARTRDGGRHWTDLGSVAQAGAVRLTGAGGWVLAATNAGTFLSRDRGRRWQRLTATETYTDPQTVSPGLLVGRAGVGGRDVGCRIAVRGDRERTPRILSGPGPPRSACLITTAAFSDSRHGVALFAGHRGLAAYTTADGGARWRRRAVLSSGPIGAEARLAVDGRTAAVVIRADAGLGPETHQAGRLAVSRDRGRSWTFIATGTAYCAVAVFEQELWLSCGPPFARGLIYHSSDAGRRWQAHHVPAALGVFQLVAVAPGRALAVPATTAHSAPLMALERGGAVLRELWPAWPLGPNALG